MTFHVLFVLIFFYWLVNNNAYLIFNVLVRPSRMFCGTWILQTGFGTIQRVTFGRLIHLSVHHSWFFGWRGQIKVVTWTCNKSEKNWLRIQFSFYNIVFNQNKKRIFILVLVKFLTVLIIIRKVWHLYCFSNLKTTYIRSIVIYNPLFLLHSYHKIPL